MNLIVPQPVTSRLEEYIKNLPILPREEVVRLFAQDLHASQASEDVLFKLKAKFLLLPQEEHTALKEDILARMHPGNSALSGLKEFLENREPLAGFRYKDYKDAPLHEAEPSRFTIRHMIPKVAHEDDGSFHFSEEDDEEISVLKAQEGSVPHGHSFETSLVEIKKYGGVYFTDDLLQKRFDTIVLSYLKGVRKDIQILDMLQNSTERGGLSFSYDKALDILHLAQKEIYMRTHLKFGEGEHIPDKERMRTEREAGERDVLKEHEISDVQKQQREIEKRAALLREISKQTPHAENTQTPLEDVGGAYYAPRLARKEYAQPPLEQPASVGGGAYYAPPPASVYIPPPAPAYIPSPPPVPPHAHQKEKKQGFSFSKIPHLFGMFGGEKKRRERFETVPYTPSLQKTQEQAPPPIISKPRVTDITTPQQQASAYTGELVSEHKLFGPLDELSALSVHDLRSFYLQGGEHGGMVYSAEGGKAFEQALRTKIEAIANKFVERRALAVEAWKQSPLNKMYASSGVEALIAGKPVEEVIAQKLARAEPTLTYEEFKLLGDINAKLRLLQ